jgi:hypothetical protein
MVASGQKGLLVSCLYHLLLQQVQKLVNIDGKWVKSDGPLEKRKEEKPLPRVPWRFHFRIRMSHSPFLSSFMKPDFIPALHASQSGRAHFKTRSL